MSSHDIRDMLDLPGEAPRPAKKQKINGPKTVLKGLAREVQNLGGDNPIAIVPEGLLFKKRRLGSRKPAAKWELTPFKNTARDDQSLILRHWRKKTESHPKSAGLDKDIDAESRADSDIEDSLFAKFNVQWESLKYDDNLYNERFESSDWSKDETDYLMSLTEEYDLRWPIIWDRYDFQPSPHERPSGADEDASIPTPPSRSMEDMKERYYKIIAELKQLSTDKLCMTTAEFNQLEAMQKFNKQQEITRKKFAEASFHRTNEEAKEEENLLLELKRILARSEKLGLERQELYSRLEAPTTAMPISAYTSSQGLQQLLTNLVQADKAKRGKSIAGHSTSPADLNNTNQQNGNSELRRDINAREPNSASSAGNKKSALSTSDRRQLTAEEELIFGVRHFDRITTTGPAFRHEKIMKPIMSKSSVQQAKINNILTELRIPPRLLMPTFRVGEVFESLQQDIILLLDQRKIVDKLDGEIRVLKTLKEERDKAATIDQQEKTSGNTDVMEE
ncbi:SWR1-complex protein 4 [Podosphaera aphanis]|nr:SWR1-complex protein 4 [Podosphaera aphanis]